MKIVAGEQINNVNVLMSMDSRVVYIMNLQSVG